MKINIPALEDPHNLIRLNLTRPYEGNVAMSMGIVMATIKIEAVAIKTDLFAFNRSKAKNATVKTVRIMVT